MSKTVLVVDDAPDISFLLGHVLKNAGMDAEWCESGSDALERLSREDLPDALVLDLQMPGMTGWDVLEQIRADERTATLPVIVCSVKAHRKDRDRAAGLGAAGYVVKPFDIQVLVRTVARVLAHA